MLFNKKILFIIISVICFSCGKKDNGSSNGTEYITVGLENENSFFKDGYIYMTTTEDIDASYHRWQAPFSFRLPDEIEIINKSGSINSTIYFDDSTYRCYYKLDKKKFVFDYCDGSNGPNFYVGSCVFLRIEGPRNFEVSVKLEEI